MTTLSRARVMRIALSERGYREGFGNANKFSRANGRPAEFWCQDFAQWVLQQGNVRTPITASCQFAESWYKRNGQLHTVPRVGDQFFVYFPGFRRVAHTGFVTGISADGRTVFTIEGNSNPGGSRNGYGVFRRARPVLAQPGRTGIRSYGRPVYGKSDVVVKPKPVKPKPKFQFKVSDFRSAIHLSPENGWGPVTDARAQAFRAVAKRQGASPALGESVREVQRACGANPDGVWGPKSRAAFRKTLPKVQLALGVAPDGSWGPVTEAAYQAARKLHKE